MQGISTHKWYSDSVISSTLDMQSKHSPRTQLYLPSKGGFCLEMVMPNGLTVVHALI